MKRIFSFISALFILSHFVTVSAESSYIKIYPFPYSSYTLGESITVRGDTNLSFVTLCLSYPNDGDYKGMSKFVITLSANEFKEGYTIRTGTFSNQWPEGLWRIRVQNDNAVDDVFVKFTAETEYTSSLYVAEYEDGAVSGIYSLPARGAEYNNGVISLFLKDEVVKIFQWNDALTPLSEGEGNIYFASYVSGAAVFVKKCRGEFSPSFPLILHSGGKTYKLFLWSNIMTPMEPPH